MGDRSFGRVIKQRRDELGLSQARVGELVGRSASTIRNWERGRSTPSDQADVATLAAVLGVEERELTELAGFETDSGPVVVESSPTVDEVYASLSFDDYVAAEDDHAAEEADFEPEAPAASVEEPKVPWVSWLEPPSDDGIEDPSVYSVQESAEWDETPEPDDAQPPDLIELTSPEPPRAWTGSVDAKVENQPEEPSEDESDRPVDDSLIGGLVGDAGVPPAVEWGEGTRSDPFVAEAPQRGRRLARAAPPTVLETAAPGEPSYLENPAERQRYRMRALLTTVIVLALVMVLFWSFDRTTDALSSMWDGIIDMLAI